MYCLQHELAREKIALRTIDRGGKMQILVASCFNFRFEKYAQMFMQKFFFICFS